MAIANNPDLVAAKYDPRVAAERVGQAKSAFLPTLQSGILRNVQNAPPTSIFFGNAGVRTDVWSGNIGLAQRLPWGGGSYNVLWNSARTDATSTLSNFNPSVTAQIQGVLTQPLLRDFKIDPYRAQLVTAERNREIADVGVQELGVSVTAGAQRAYWNLVLANASVTVQQRALDLAMELERNNRARVDVGQSPPLDLVAARAEVAQRRENLIVAQTQVREAEDALRIMILDPGRPDFWTVRLQVTDLVPPVGVAPDVDAAVRFALQNRTDLVRTRKQIDIADTNVTLAKSEVLPDLRVQANYLTAGLGGTELIRNGGIFGPVTGTAPLAYGDVLRQTFVGDYPTWTVGFTLSYPLGHSNEEAALARTRLEREQTQARLRSAELRAVREVRQAAMQLEQNRQRIETTRLARELSEQRLDAEQKRYEVGMSTNFNVIQAQRDLAVAQDNELQAQLDYEITLINFETVQRVSASNGAAAGASTPTTTSGSSTSFGTAGSASTPAATTTSGGGGV
jgi:outer membrane protein TolC